MWLFFIGGSFFHSLLYLSSPHSLRPLPYISILLLYFMPDASRPVVIVVESGAVEMFKIYNIDYAWTKRAAVIFRVHWWTIQSPILIPPLRQSTTTRRIYGAMEGGDGVVLEIEFTFPIQYHNWCAAMMRCVRACQSYSASVWFFLSI